MIDNDAGYRDRGRPELLERVGTMVPLVEFTRFRANPDVGAVSAGDKFDRLIREGALGNNNAAGGKVQHVQAGIGADPEELVFGDCEIGD